nr:immunoglobulin light chain junction region [Macaca mulatta]MOV63164.1 immunoglobulin light chain junction region [Macaca mulatta]MOV64217.1 immunoglobulin light chain junction region [Macaca mulatta]MOW08293.1 immunoglobulin light chain junction region [Macaca mulatta]MOW08542.1 immunoglobulin light chain junction region [Macaca mulatta]
CQQHNSYPITF